MSCNFRAIFNVGKFYNAKKITIFKFEENTVLKLSGYKGSKFYMN